MNTGIKQLDRLIAKHGVSTGLTHNDFQSSVRLYHNDHRLNTLRLPYCQYRIVEELREGEHLTLHRFYLAYNENTPRLAFFLIDANNEVVDKVFFLKHNRYKVAAHAIGKLLRTQHAIAA